MSSDKDFLQLLTPKTQVYSPTKKKIYQPKDILDEFGVSHFNYINYKMLMGDASDNLPGVSGLGPKKLIKLFPNLLEDRKIELDEILSYSAERVDEHNLYASVMERRHQLDINRQLMDLQIIPISKENQDEIKTGFNTSYSLNKHMFMQMYLADKLGESIPNTSNWINQIFGGLDSF
jgi:5'-3' exonuclease